MNEIFEFLGTIRVFAWAYLGVLLVIAAGLAIFDRRTHVPSEHMGEATPERKAA